MNTAEDPTSEAQIRAIHERLARLENFAESITKLFAAAGGVLDMIKLVNRQIFHPDPLADKPKGA